MATADTVILRVLAGMGEPVQSTKLVKLVYLVDYLHFQYYGSTLTGFQYMWDHYGPNALSHAIINEAHDLADRGLVKTTYKPNIYDGMTIAFEAHPSEEPPPLSDEAEMVVDDVIHQYSMLSIEEITELTKETAPFKKALRYSLLSMEHSAPAGRTNEEEWGAYQHDLKEHGTVSLEDVKQRYELS